MTKTSDPDTVGAFSNMNLAASVSSRPSRKSGGKEEEVAVEVPRVMTTDLSSQPNPKLPRLHQNPLVENHLIQLKCHWLPLKPADLE